MWAYGVTTVPKRRDDLLPRTLASLKAAGFDAPRLFVDGIDNREAPHWEARFGLPVTARGPTPLKTFGNWFLGVWELYVRNPNAVRFAMFQDDMVTCVGLRQYLDRCAWPERAYLNLYTFPQNRPPTAPGPVSAGRVGWFEGLEAVSAPEYCGRRGQCGLGAVALCFTREAVLDLLSSRHLVERPMDAKRGTSAIDGGIVTAMNKLGWREWVHDPSLVQHVGDVSSMGNKRHPDAPTFPGEKFNVLSLIDSR